jgi:cystathionine beta-lyase
MLRPPERPFTPGGAAHQPETRAFSFDKVVDRRNTDCLKYDAAVKRGYPANILPFWVADMDFPTAPPILDALRARTDHGIFGYTDPQDSYYQTIQDWWKINHSYALQKEWILDSPGVVFSLCTAVRAFTEPGDSIIIQTPVYYPFFSSILQNGRKLVSSPLTYLDRKYTIDFEGFEERIKAHKVKMFILCNPHNPVGRVWNPLELQRLGQICQRNGVLVVADEVHCDFISPGFKHCVFAGLQRQLEQITITLAAPSKTFNLAGLQISHVFIANDKLRKAWLDQKTATGYSEPNAMGVAACRAAYAKGRPWLDSLLQYINDNDAFVQAFLKQFLSTIYPVGRQGTYLLWLDCRGARFSHEDLCRRLVDKGKLWLYDGSKFGQEGTGFQRLNLACPREVLSDAMLRLAAVLSQ